MIVVTTAIQINRDRPSSVHPERWERVSGHTIPRSQGQLNRPEMRGRRCPCVGSKEMMDKRMTLCHRLLKRRQRSSLSRLFSWPVYARDRASIGVRYPAGKDEPERTGNEMKEREAVYCRDSDKNKYQPHERRKLNAFPKGETGFVLNSQPTPASLSNVGLIHRLILSHSGLCSGTRCSFTLSPEHSVQSVKEIRRSERWSRTSRVSVHVPPSRPSVRT